MLFRSGIFGPMGQDIDLFRTVGNVPRRGTHDRASGAKVGLTIRRDELEPICFFKDKLASSAMSPMAQEQRAQLLAHQKKLEYPDRSLLVRVIGKLRKIVHYQTCLMGLRIASLRNINFYYR